MIPPRSEKTLPLPLPAVPPAAYDELCSFLRQSHSALTPRGEAVSPNQMVQQVCADKRSAWQQLWIRLPGEKDWTKAMGDALGTALTLVEHANHQSQNTLERRLPRYRREHDLLDDIH